MLRTLTFMVGLTGAFGSAQLPEFSQQYAQRLGGAVDALSEVVNDFDASAAAAGLTRPQALQQMEGSAFLEKRRADMEVTFERHAALQDQLVQFSDAGPFVRSYRLLQADRGVVRATASLYRPALPLTTTGAIFALFGFLLAGGLLQSLIWLLRPVWRASA